MLANLKLPGGPWMGVNDVLNASSTAFRWKRFKGSKPARDKFSGSLRSKKNNK